MTQIAPPPPLADRYEMVVGLEVHVHLDTATKIFCRCSTDFGAAECEYLSGVPALPGALPVLNTRVVDLAIRAALALGCTVQGTSVARKNTLSRFAQGLPDLALR
jgi:aspartyl-tRNA(Asn)/glutamyl-tRNA(Gln) amidotransferase subunit B